MTLLVECLGKFTETRNMGVAGGAHASYDEDSLADCQRSCLEANPDCYGVDYKNGVCTLIDMDAYNHEKVTGNFGNVHSVLKPCDSSDR